MSGGGLVMARREVRGGGEEVKCGQKHRQMPLVFEPSASPRWLAAATIYKVLFPTCSENIKVTLSCSN